MTITIDHALASTVLAGLPVAGGSSVVTADILVATGLSDADLLPGEFIIYDLYDRETGKHYVGVTKRRLPARTSAHASQARRDGRVRPGGLMERLRQVFAEGRTMPEAFEVRVLAAAVTPAEARALERHWIRMLNSAHPDGYNLLPGGSSLGGPANRLTITVRRGRKRETEFASIGDAITDRNTVLRAAGRPALLEGTVYARLASGWSPGQALGWQGRQDGRRRRAPFTILGRVFTSLATAARQTGIGIATLRSRLHRWWSDGVAGMPEIGHDRRGARGPSRLLRIVWPATGERLTAAAFAERTGMPKASILHRWHRLQGEAATAGRLPTAQEVHDALIAGSDRRKPVRLVLPGGEVLEGGEREVIGRLLSHPAAGSRTRTLSFSGIRRRLRLLGEDERRQSARIGWAFGF